MNVVQTVLTYTVFLPMLFGCGGGDVFTDTVALNTTLNIANANGIIQRLSGVWQALSTGVAGGVADVETIAIAPDGTVYIGGAFTTAGGVTVNNIFKWDGTTITALGSGTVGTSGTVWALAIDAEGNLFVGGSFATAGGVTVNQFAMWDGTSWNALGAGTPGVYHLTDPAVFSLAMDESGNVYLGGKFTKVQGAGGTLVNSVAKWDGSAYSALGAGTPGVQAVTLQSGTVWALLVDRNEKLWVGGQFAKAGGADINRLAKWNGTTWSAFGTGPNDDVYKLAMKPNGDIFVGGKFTSIDGTAAKQVAKYDNSSWSEAGGGVTSGGTGIFVLYYSPFDDALYAGGGFTKIGDANVADRIAIFNGSDWNNIDVDLPGTANVNAIADKQNELYLGFDTAGTATTSGVPTTIVNHTGTTRAFPTITLTRAGGTTAVLESIQNLTTGKVLLFDHALLDGERIVIDLTPYHKVITTYVGDSTNNALSDLLPGSDFGSFALMPGVNDIALYISETGSPTLTAFIQWQTTYPIIDGAP